MPQRNGAVYIDDADVAMQTIQPIVAEVLDGAGLDAFVRVYEDTRSLYAGRYPGYRASNTRYHDFAHALSVVLAAARLLHGCRESGLSIMPRQGLTALIAAFFHDAGFIQTEEDHKGSGAKYTVGHEERSIRFLRRYLAGTDFSTGEIENGADFIRCTTLGLSPTEIDFSSAEAQTCGCIVGSADLLAQLADRLYLEKLLLLFMEFEEARLPEFQTALELLQKTVDFYDSVARKRLDEQLGGVHRHMRTHFQRWLGVDEDGYARAISQNIAYLKTMIDRCGDVFDCYLRHLRRGGIADRVRDEMGGTENAGLGGFMHRR